VSPLTVVEDLESKIAERACAQFTNRTRWQSSRLSVEKKLSATALS
jgi:hypothetical protein